MTPKNNNIIAPRGFLFAAGDAGLRTHGSGADVALIYSTAPARAAAVFTSNKVKAAPVELSQQHLRKSRQTAQAILVNAGNANCATGARGMATARRCAAAAGKLLELPPEQVLIASTGVIGVPLDDRKITDVLPAVVRQMHPESFQSVSKAILTTDTRPKLAFRSLLLNGSKVNILGICKGAGMIHPHLATMLGFFLTDAALDRRFMQACLSRACDNSFNCVSVDGDTSTNDTVFLMANGMAANSIVRENSNDAEKFESALSDVAQQLAIQIAKDGEGAERLVEIRVERAASKKQAEAIARAIALSSLVKTAIAGADPNWGRILSAAGNSGVEFNPVQVDIYLQGVLVCRKGGAADYDEPSLQSQMRRDQVAIRVVLKQGRESARFWTCDLTEEYIRINASYRT